ncbi:hypothetical protein V1525DRAFT_422708 [Lipomyces kononenkoae]|uniref:Uncharacterized protein n=1 Tax=Lipomyces kononenkoae TaxID=34357 RepID=A0ACC3ST39_LIPKO
MATVAKSSPIILAGPGDWDEWMIVKTQARTNGIWEYIDPEKAPQEVAKFVEPKRPSINAVNASAENIMDLDDAEIARYSILQKDYAYDRERYRESKRALDDLSKHILGSISRSYLLHVEDKATVYDMLQALRKRIAPTDMARKLEAKTKYRQALRSPKSSNVDAWIEGWERAYTNAKRQNKMSMITKSGYWRQKLERLQRKGSQVPDGYEIAEYFRNDWRKRKADALYEKAGSFAITLQGRESENPVNSKQSCLCGRNHSYRKCWYLVESSRKPGWQPDAAIEARIKETLEKDPKLRAKIESIKNQTTQKASDQTKSSDPTKPIDKEGKEATNHAPALSFIVSGIIKESVSSASSGLRLPNAHF